MNILNSKAIARVRAALISQIESREDGTPPELMPPDQDPATLEKLSEIFGLSPFERDVLLLCAGMEIYGDWGNLCGQAQRNPERNYPTFNLALTIFPNANWAAIAPIGSLRRWRLIEIGNGNALTSSPLRIDERILHYLAGVEYLDDRLLGIIEEVPEAAELVPSHSQLAREMAEIWVQASQQGEKLPVLQLCGAEIAGKRAIAAAACASLGLKLHAISADAIPTDLDNFKQFQYLCEREWLLSSRVLLLDSDEIGTSEPERPERKTALTRFVETIQLPLIVTSHKHRRTRERSQIIFDVDLPTTDEQRTLWEKALGDIAPNPGGQIETLVSQFNLAPPQIAAACLQIASPLNSADNLSPEATAESIWDACRIQARSHLDELAQRIDSKATWSDLILPDKEQQMLRDIAIHLQQRAKVYENWGMGGKSARGLGINALFAGASGTGKTMAAEVLAGELRLDLYRIDLSIVVSKYIGETEKNLRRVFDAAESGSVILLFDEADALFGKRSQVKDSHDRHANIEVSYLLQRMEAYRGLAIMTTNLQGSIDPAFIRRIRFIVQFPLPDIKQRAAIWRNVFPKETPIEDLKYDKLAKLGVAGGNIRNIALNAAFLAADAGEAVQMKYILQATKREYIKMGRILQDEEIKGWL